MEKRFSKSNVRELIDKRIVYYESEYGFKRSTGWAQVEGAGEAVNRAYGAYDELLDLIDAFGL